MKGICNFKWQKAVDLPVKHPDLLITGGRIVAALAALTILGVLFASVGIRSFHLNPAVFVCLRGGELFTAFSFFYLCSIRAADPHELEPT
jgi:hypothetical protein